MKKSNGERKNRLNIRRKTQQKKQEKLGNMKKKCERKNRLNMCPIPLCCIFSIFRGVLVFTSKMHIISYSSQIFLGFLLGLSLYVQSVLPSTMVFHRIFTLFLTFRWVFANFQVCLKMILSRKRIFMHIRKLFPHN